MATQQHAGTLALYVKLMLEVSTVDTSVLLDVR
jgi:hypothetical protein